MRGSLTHPQLEALVFLLARVLPALLHLRVEHTRKTHTQNMYQTVLECCVCDVCVMLCMKTYHSVGVLLQLHSAALYTHLR